MGAGRTLALFHGAFLREAAESLQEELDPRAAAISTLGADQMGHG
jgi:hypothetical protein